MLQLPDLSKHSVFLWGPRKTGKSYWIRNYLPDAPIIDLLKSDVFADFSSRPSLLRERYSERTVPYIVIDEIQKCPALLDEVHWLMENCHIQFLLTGSSARKLRRHHANLLGGRAWRREMRPICFPEMEGFALQDFLQSGLLPSHLLSTAPQEDLRAYVADYLRDEIALEAAVRNLPAFSEFLRVAAISSSELLNYTNVGRETGVSPKVVRGYFELLEDTFLGYRLPPWRRAVNRRLVDTEKFYIFDVGVSNYLARRTPLIGSSDFGKAFEHYILMELIAWRSYRSPEATLSFWRSTNKQEVDFIVNDKELAVEVKSGTRVHDGDIRGLTILAEDGPVKRRVVVALENEPRVIRDRFGPIEILPWRVFLTELWGM